MPNGRPTSPSGAPSRKRTSSPTSNSRSPSGPSASSPTAARAARRRHRLARLGIHHDWFMQFWNARRPRPCSIPRLFRDRFRPGSILGAKLAAPDPPCVSICGDSGFAMVPHVLSTAVEYNIPAVSVVWNNFSSAAIHDLHYAYFDRREIGTSFYQGPEKKTYNHFAAWARARASRNSGHQVQDFRHAGPAVALGRPCLIDVHVDADVRPPAPRPGPTADSAQGTSVPDEIRTGK